MVSIGWVGFDSLPDQELIAEKNLTLCVKFGIILIESERVTILNGTGLVRERNPLSLHFETIAPKGLKVINMV